MPWSKTSTKIGNILFLAFLLLASCQNREEPVHDFYSSELFKQVQLAGVFEDSKTFVDCVPKQNLQEIQSLYLTQREAPEFDLKTFVLAHFELPSVDDTGFITDTTKTMGQHIKTLWPVLTRKPDQYHPYSSLIALPNEYIVPGGRFREIYYWDSYFTLEGLMVSGQQTMAKNMIDNFSFLVDTLGFIPNGNREYYLGRSQPPFFSLMVDRLAGNDRDLFVGYLPYLLTEYRFWMKGEDQLSNTLPANQRIVMMDDGVVLNRYWDDLAGPRPESYKEDATLVAVKSVLPGKAYTDLRAGAESGWDYSSRWFEDHQNLSTIHTTDIIPVDLNSLLYHLELKIAQGYNWKGQLDSAQLFLDKAGIRKKGILKYLWDEEDQFFIDYDFVKKKKTGVLSLAGAYPLYFNLATKAQAKPAIDRLIRDFLKDGGFVTTLNETGQQWDAPNGWAPLQWITANGLFNYNYHKEGLEAMERWLNRNEEVYKSTGKMMEKYDVVNTSLLAGGGEYPLQDGFGWTNGVALAFLEILREKALVEEMMQTNP